MTSPKGAVRRLAGARLVSLLGTGAANVALLVSMYESTGSAAWVSATLVATHGVQVFFALFTAGLGDRLDRRRLMVACEVAGSGCYLAMVFTPAPGPLLAVALLSAVVASPFHSASAAAIPNLVGREHLSWANSMVSAGRNLGMTLGPVLGGLLAATLGPGTVFGANAVSFLLSALVISTVRGRFSGERATGDDYGGRPRRPGLPVAEPSPAHPPLRRSGARAGARPRAGGASAAGRVVRAWARWRWVCSTAPGAPAC